MAGLHLTELTLSHFRSHRVARLTVDARPIALHGANGAGKTNILEAISLLSPGRGLRRAAPGDLSRKPEALGWRIGATLRSGHQVHEIDARAEDGMPRTLRIDGKTAPQVALGRIARILWLVPSMDRLWMEGAEGRRRFLDRMTLSFEPGHADAVLIYEKAMRERNRLLKDMVRDATWYAALEAQMAESGAEIRRNRTRVVARLTEAQLDADTSFPTAELSLSEPDEASDLGDALAASRPDDLRAGRTLVGPHRADLDAVYLVKGAPAAQCSTGEQKALLISIILSNARALARDLSMPPIVLLDEVAAHLDPDRRAALYDEICALGSQAWLTGTERGLFDALGDRAQYFAVSETDGQSETTPA